MTCQKDNHKKNGEIYKVDSDPVQYSDNKDAKWTFKAGKYTYGYSSVVTTDANGLINKATFFSFLGIIKYEGLHNLVYRVAEKATALSNLSKSHWINSGFLSG